LQAYLRRTEADCRDLADPGARVRLCKGAYAEPESVAYQTRLEVDKSYVRCLNILMAGEGYPMLATHDPRLNPTGEARARWFDRSPEELEFQMLYGVRPAEQLRLAEEGYPVRVYVPYGTQWYAYLMRRLAERPANLAFLGRALRSRTRAGVDRGVRRGGPASPDGTQLRPGPPGAARGGARAAGARDPRAQRRVLPGVGFPGAERPGRPGPLLAGHHARRRDRQPLADRDAPRPADHRRPLLPPGVPGPLRRAGQGPPPRPGHRRHREPLADPVLACGHRDGGVADPPHRGGPRARRVLLRHPGRAGRSVPG